MIDVSELPRIQQTVVLLVERSGRTGMRPVEIVEQAGGSESRVIEALSLLTKTNVLIKISGNTPRYYTPATAVPTPVTGVTSPHVCNVIKKVKKEGKRKFEQQSLLRTTDNILAQVAADKMPEFAHLVHSVWVKLNCRIGEGFSPDLIHRIAFAMMSAEFPDVTEAWLAETRDAADTALRSNDTDKIKKRWYLVANRLRCIYESREWWWTACRPVFKCVQAERLQSQNEGRPFRYALFPMEKERVAVVKKTEQPKQPETRIDYMAITLSFEATMRHLNMKLWRSVFEEKGYFPLAGQACDAAVREFYGNKIPIRYIKFCGGQPKSSAGV